MRDVLDTAIEAVYAAAIGDIGWSAALAAVARAVGAERALLYTPERAQEAGGLWAIHEDTPHPRDLIRAVDGGGAPTSSLGIHAVYSTVLGERSGETPATLFVLFSREARNRFALAHAQAVEQVRRHLLLAVRLWFRTRAARQASELLALGMNVGLLLADADGRVRWMNPRAQAWLREGRLAIADGRLSAIRGVPDPQALVRDACAGEAALVGGDCGETIEIVPLPAAAEGAGESAVRALVLLRDGAACRQGAAALARQFQLTPSETELAVALWKGRLLGEYAERRSVAMSTVRTQLKSLLAKTGSRRQSDVVALVARMQPLLGALPPDRRVMADFSGATREDRARRDTSNGG